MKAHAIFAILAAGILASVDPALGGLVPGKQSARISPLLNPPKFDCSGWNFIIGLNTLFAKIEDEVDAGIQATRDAIGGPADFDQAMDNFRSFNEGELEEAVTIFFDLAGAYPWDCETLTFIAHLFGVHAETAVVRAGNTLAALAFLKSPELHDVVKMDMAARTAVIVQDIEDMQALIVECQPYWC